MKISCLEKYVLIDRAFQFEFACQYTEYQQLSQQQFDEQIHDQDVIILSDLTINEKILQHNPKLKLVALCSTGYDHIDIALLKQHGVKVCNVRGHAHNAVAEHAFTLMINLFKQFHLQSQGVHDLTWSKSNSAFYLAAPIRELYNKTLVIIGKGAIGSSLAEKAKAFGMQVIFSERKHATVCREGYMPFDQAIAQADVVSLHCELNDETRHLIDLAVLKQMKPDSVLINVGRGGLIQDADLVYALTHHLIAGFAADVLSQEPPPQDHPLLTLQHANVLLTGHIAWASDEAQLGLFQSIQDNINRNIQGREQNIVE